MWSLLRLLTHQVNAKCLRHASQSDIRMHRTYTSSNQNLHNSVGHIQTPVEPFDTARVRYWFRIDLEMLSELQCTPF